jgi:hypothetical protein
MATKPEKKTDEQAEPTRAKVQADIHKDFAAIMTVAKDVLGCPPKTLKEFNELFLTIMTDDGIDEDVVLDLKMVCEEAQALFGADVPLLDVIELYDSMFTE